MEFTRRDLGKLALGAVPAAWLAGGERTAGSAMQAARPNSQWGGVQVGIITPYSFQGTATTAQEILASTVALGVSAVELRGDVAEIHAGLPPAPAAVPGGATGGEPTQAQLAAQKARGAVVRKWRLSQAMTKFGELRQMYEKAGVAIRIARFPLGDGWTDEEIDYAFQAAKALGATAINCEPPVSQTKRIGLFADKHQMLVGYHNHANVTDVEAFGRPGSWEQAFFYSSRNGANLDIGHFVAGNSRSPIPFIQEYHARITGLHLKDRRMNGGPNVPWGEGDTPIREVLQLMKREKYPFMATIELEYRVDGSDTMTELKKCVEFCRRALE